MSQAGRLVVAGLALGVLAFLLFKPAREAAFDAVDDFTMENFGYRIMNNEWMKDLYGRGAAYAAALEQAEDRHGIPQYLLARLAWQESRFREDIICGQTRSSAGALGIMQIVPRWHPGVDPLDPYASIEYAAAFLARLHRQFGTWELALKAYNWGPGNVNKWLAGEKAEPTETRNYSGQILADLGMERVYA